jgi:precorrin-6B methylase 2
MPRQWTAETLLELARDYQPACVLLAAAELDVFGALAGTPMTAGELAAAVRGDRRATAILADALVALGALQKNEGVYATAPGVAETLTGDGSSSVLPMLRHQANCLRRWARLAAVVRAGRPGEREPSIRGGAADREAFIEAMEVASRAAAPRLVAALGPPSFEHLLDLGGGPGTWTIAFLRAAPDARATLYDLPEVIPIARRHVEAAGLADRVGFVEGDFETDETLPPGADLAWVSAIVHQNSRERNRRLLARVRAALAPRGRVMIRDIVMDESHTSPPGGAMFAVNMLAGTEGGGTFSLAELSEDLRQAGFRDPHLTRGERDMDSVVTARKA